MRGRGITVALAIAAGVGWLAGAPAPADAHLCGVCASFVTTHDPDGAGPAGARTRMHEEIVPNVPYALDVDGNLPPLPLGLLPVLPGYEMRVNVQGLDAVRPTITIQRLLGTLPVLPLRIEVVTGDGSRSTSLGYDTLTSSAPQSFVARIDRSDRDGIGETSQVLLRLAIAGAASRLTLVNEEFGGNPAGTRTDRQIRRLEFQGDGVTTRVPSNLGLDLTTTATRQRAVVTRDARTKLSFEVAEPGDGPRTTGVIDELPSRVDLTLADVDVNGDGEADKTIDYVATAVTGDASLATTTSEQTTDVTVEDLPSEAHLTYVSAPGDEDVALGAPDQTKIVYHANGRAEKAVVRTDDGERRLLADVDNLPANIDELSTTTVPDGGRIVLDADGGADRAEVDVVEGGKHTEAIVTDVPADITLDHSSSDAAGRVHYVADDLAGRADILLVDDEGQRTTIGVDDIPSDVLVTYEKDEDALDFDYAANGEVPRAEIHGTNFRGLPDRAKEIHLVLERVPTGVGFSVVNTEDTTVDVNEVDPPELCQHIPPEEADENPQCPGHEDYEPPTETITRTTKESDLSITTPGGRLGSGELQLTSGPDDRLAATSENGLPLDGVMLQDLSDRFVAFARVSEFDQLAVRGSTVTSKRRGPGFPRDSSHGSMHASLDTLAEDHALALDIDKQGSGDTVASTDAVLASLPAHIELDTSGNSTFGESKTDWSASRAVDGWLTSEIDGERRPGFSLTERVRTGTEPVTINEQTTLDPMPAEFSACQVARLNTCSEGHFDENLARLRDGDGPYRTRGCAPTPCTSDPSFPIEVDHAGGGSFLLKADTPTHLVHRTGDWFDRSDPYTIVEFRNLTRYGLQGNTENYPCSFGSLTQDCKQGYVAMDTGGQPITGRLEQKGESSFTRLLLPEGFLADRLVWAFNKTGAVSGQLATIGTLNCPPGTEVQLGGETLNERFCDGDVLEGGILDQL
ncbi:MAG: hypothetical protein WD844_02960 [Thermoleophilaceae bacterium]